MPVTEPEIQAALRHVIDPLTGQDIVSAGLVSGIVIRDGRVGLMITITREEQAVRSPLIEAVREALIRLPGVSSVTPVLTAQTGDSSPDNPPSRNKATWNLTPVANVSRVVAIASGKGGVGKSTVTALLALSLTGQGRRVGIVDADIHGPSIPYLLELPEGVRPELDATGRMIPPVSHDIQCMSAGLFLDPSQAAIMRGPMVAKTLQQLIRGAAWGAEGRPLDVLLIDLPPGTGDIHLSLVQQLPLALNGGGALIVTTPAPLSLLDARKCAVMFTKTDVPILGIIENMSWLEDATGAPLTVFGSGAGEALAEETHSQLLAQIPIDPALSQELSVTGLTRSLSSHKFAWENVVRSLAFTRI